MPDLFIYIGSCNGVVILLHNCIAPDFNPSVGQAAVSTLKQASLLESHQTTAVVYSVLQDNTRILAVYNGWVDEKAPHIVPTVSEARQMIEKCMTGPRKSGQPLLAVSVTFVPSDKVFNTRIVLVTVPMYAMDKDHVSLHNPKDTFNVGFDKMLLLTKATPYNAEETSKRDRVE